MYNAFRTVCEQVLRIPPDPEPPPGDHTSTQIFRAAPNYYKYLLFIWGVTTLAGLVGICFFSIAPAVGYHELAARRNHAAGLLLLIPIALLVLLVISRLVALAVVTLNFEKRWYVVTDRSLRVREGVIGVREMTITFANIQNISIDQGPIQRILRIADLKVETAGGGPANPKNPGQNLHTAYFRGIDNATEVRELIQQRLKHLKDSGLGDHEELRSSRPGPLDAGFLDALREVAVEAAALRVAIPSSRV